MVSYKTAKQPVQRIEEMIFLIRGQRVMLDSDLAKIYGVTTKQLNQQFKRNRGRFPEDFAFALTDKEVVQMRSQNVTSSRRNIRHRPIAFSEHGEHDGAIEAIRQLLNSKEKPQREIGFHIREQAPPYRVVPKKRF